MVFACSARKAPHTRRERFLALGAALQARCALRLLPGAADYLFVPDVQRVAAKDATNVWPPWASPLAQQAAETTASPDEFLFAIEVGNAAISHRLPIRSPLAFRVAVRRSDGRAETFRLADVPGNRFALAIREQFGNGPTFLAILHRWLACQSLFGVDDRVYTYVTQGPHGRVRVSDAMLNACAVEPLLPPWAQAFDPDTFFERVARLTAQQAAARRQT